MPKMEVVFYRDEKGDAPVLDWLDNLSQKAQDKCVVRIERLEELGHELRRPEADFLRDGIHELRAKHQRVNLRILYFFHGKEAVVLASGLTKQRSDVPTGEIDQAIERRKLFVKDPVARSYKED